MDIRWLTCSVVIYPVHPHDHILVYFLTCFVFLGCRNALVNVEAQPVTASSFTRKCVVAKIKELTIDRFKDAVQQNAGGLLVIVPRDLHKLPVEDKEVNYLK